MLMNDEIKVLPFTLPKEWSETTKKIILENTFNDITEHLKDVEWLRSMAQDLRDDNCGMLEVFGELDSTVLRYEIAIREIELTAKEIEITNQFKEIEQRDYNQALKDIKKIRGK